MRIFVLHGAVNCVFTDESRTLDRKSLATLLLFFVDLLRQLPAASSMLAWRK